MKKRIFGAALVSLLVGFYIGNTLVDKKISPQTLMKELRVLLHEEKDPSKNICLDCDIDGFKESEIDIKDADGEGSKTIFDAEDADASDGGVND